MTMCCRRNLVFSPQQLSVDEGDTATYRLSLATQPTGGGDSGCVL